MVPSASQTRKTVLRSADISEQCVFTAPGIAAINEYELTSWLPNLRRQNTLGGKNIVIIVQYVFPANENYTV